MGEMPVRLSGAYGPAALFGGLKGVCKAPDDCEEHTQDEVEGDHGLSSAELRVAAFAG